MLITLVAPWSITAEVIDPVPDPSIWNPPKDDVVMLSQVAPPMGCKGLAELDSYPKPVVGLYPPNAFNTVPAGNEYAWDDETSNLIKSLGQKTLTIDLHETIKTLPESLKNYKLTIVNEGLSIDYQYDTQSKQTGITSLLQDMKEAGLKLKDLNTEQSSLEKIFVELVKEK